MDLWMIGFWDAGILGDGWVNDIDAYNNGYNTSARMFTIKSYCMLYVKLVLVNI